MDRAERRRRTQKKLLARIRFLKQLRLPHDPELSRAFNPSHDSAAVLGYCGDQREIGMCRKKHPFDCGRPRCGVCSGYNRYGREITRQEIIAQRTYAEGRAEQDEHDA